MRLTKNQRRQQEAERQIKVSAMVRAAIGDRVICSRCGATLETFSDQCSADLLYQCPGFLEIERVRNPIVKEVYGF